MPNTITPSTVDFLLGTLTPFAESTDDPGGVDSFSRLSSAVLGPKRLRSSWSASGPETFTEYLSGLLAVFYRYGASDGEGGVAVRCPVALFDLATGELVDTMADDSIDFTIGAPDTIADLPVIGCGITPIQAAHEGYLYWISDPNAVIPGSILRLVRWGWFADGAGGAAWAKKSTAVGSALIGAPAVDLITDVTALPKSVGIDFLVARGQIDPATEKHLYALITTLNQSYVDPDADDTDAFFTLWSRSYTDADWAAWATDPDTLLAVDVVPQAGRPSAGNIVGLFGDYDLAATVHAAISNPRLAVIAGTGQTAYQKVTVAGDDAVPEAGAGDIIESFAAGSYKAHGMVLDQLGFVYTVGTGGMAGSNEHLIEKWKSWDLAAGPVAYVDHADADNGNLGSAYASAADTHVYAPCWTGQYLVVADHGPASTLAKVFTADLEFVGQFTISATGTGTRWFGGKASNGFHARTR